MVTGPIDGSNNVGRTLGIGYTSSIHRTDKVGDISFKRTEMSASVPKELSAGTANFLANLNEITFEMADDLLATPYVSLDLNG